LIGLEEAWSSQQTAITALNDLIRVIHTYKLNLLRRTTEDLKMLERIIQSAVREVDSATSPDLQALLTMSPAEQRSKLQFTTVMQTSSNNMTLALLKSVNVFISKQFSILPTAQEPVKFILYMEPTKAYLSPAPFTLSYEAHIADLITFAEFTALCFLPSSNVFATGTRNNRHTLSIDCIGEYAVPLADTLDVHWGPGLILVRAKAYLFGGLKGGNSAVCEMYDLYENDWAMLPDMLTPRSHFQPTVHKQFIYIFGGLDVDKAERFDLTRYSFEPLNLSVPGRHFITTYCHGDVFYLFTRTEVLRWDQRGPLQKIKEGLSVAFYSQMSPLKLDQELYFFGSSDEEHYLMKFHLETYKLDIALQFGVGAN